MLFITTLIVRTVKGMGQTGKKIEDLTTAWRQTSKNPLNLLELLNQG